jgi:hypothetical protein
MGPVRRQLILLLAPASPAFAEVCDKTRPGWTPADGPVSALGELLVFATTPAALLVLVAVAAGWYLRQQLLLSAVMLASLVFIIPQKWPVNPDLLLAARSEGCIGPPTLVIGFLGLIWCMAVAGLIFRRKGG